MRTGTSKELLIRYECLNNLKGFSDPFRGLLAESRSILSNSNGEIFCCSSYGDSTVIDLMKNTVHFPAIIIGPLESIKTVQRGFLRHLTNIFIVIYFSVCFG